MSANYSYGFLDPVRLKKGVPALALLFVVHAGFTDKHCLCRADQPSQESNQYSTQAQEDSGDTEQDSPGDSTDGASRKYHWLFRQPTAEESSPEIENLSLLEKLDKDIKQARRLYLSGETDNAIIKYRSILDHFQVLVDDVPVGHAIIQELSSRLQVFDEMAAKILGPLDGEPKEDAAGLVFHLFEKRRLCRRNLVLKKAGPLEFYDVPQALLKEEQDILRKLLEVSSDIPTSRARRTEDAVRVKLADVRKSLQKSSERYSIIRMGYSPTLEEVRKEILSDDELILDLNILSDRIVAGVITSQSGIYYQAPLAKNELEKGIISLQEKIREFTLGGRSSFMGHAWKEPCRRTYRALFGRLPRIPKDKSTVFVIPDKSIWYLPFHILLDAEDKPFGQDRSVSLIPSVDMLKFLRSKPENDSNKSCSGQLDLFESTPMIPEKDPKDASHSDPVKKKSSPKISESEKIERMILANNVFPKPSDAVIKIQKLFRKAEVWIGPAATRDRFLEIRDKQNDVEVLAVPLSMKDAIDYERQPTLFFSPDKAGKRKLEARNLFRAPLGTRMTALPIAWSDAGEKESITGEGPLFLAMGMYYSGFKAFMINYAAPNWGEEQDPYLFSVLKKCSEKSTLKQALTGYNREIPGGLDPSFTGKPPSWAGWIIYGDPGK
jgi:hypothetical protein